MRDGKRETANGKRKRRVKLTLLCALLAAPLFADTTDDSRDEFKRTFQKTVALRPGQKLRIEHSNGAIRIRTQREPQA